MSEAQLEGKGITPKRARQILKMSKVLRALPRAPRDFYSQSTQQQLTAVTRRRYRRIRELWQRHMHYPSPGSASVNSALLILSND